LKGLLLALTVLLVSCGQTPTPETQTSTPQVVTFTGPALHLLFIGNSYTAVNNLPGLFSQLAASGHHEVLTDMITPGGFSLAQHAANQTTMDKISGQKWDFVILQDQSYLPALEEQRTKELNPAVRYLDYYIRKAGSQSLLYLTWGRQKGLPEQGFNDFDSMQTQLTKGYLDIAQELKIPVAPVGEAFKIALGRDSSADLWGPDGSHPSVEGTYLAACVFYAVLFKTSPEGLDFTAGLSKDLAQTMQEVAVETVLTNLDRWYIR
jgi:hypothetical protein